MTTGINNQVASLQTQLAQGLQQLQGLGINVGGGGATTAATAATAALPGAAAALTGAAAGSGEPKSKVPATGKPQALLVNGVRKYYDGGIDPATGQMRPDGTAHEVSAFQFTKLQEFKPRLETKPGISAGLNNLAKIFGARQERISALSNALALDADSENSISPVDLQALSMETTTTQQLSELQKKIFDSMQASVSAWVR